MQILKLISYTYFLSYLNVYMSDYELLRLHLCMKDLSVPIQYKQFSINVLHRTIFFYSSNHH